MMTTTQTYSALIVDDELLARRRIRQVLEDHPDFKTVAEFGNAEEAMRFLTHQRVDVMFLDIQMPGLDGFSLLQALGTDQLPHVVFVTAYEEYAVKAFEVEAVDYLLKPFDRNRFATALGRVRKQLAQPAAAGATPGTQAKLSRLIESLAGRENPQRLAIKNNGQIVFVNVRDIDWVEAADNYVCIHCGPETHVARETMNAMAERLDAAQFARIHRSTIVNVDRIERLQPWFRGDYLVLLRGGKKLTMSRTYREKLQDTLLRTL